MFSFDNQEFVRFLHNIGETTEWIQEDGNLIKADCVGNEKYLKLMFAYIAKRDCNNWRKSHGIPFKRKGLSKRKQKMRKYVYCDEAYRFLTEKDLNSERQLYSSVMRTSRRYNPSIILKRQ